VPVSFRRNGDGTFGITLPIHDRTLLEQLIPQMRELIEQHDTLTWRLFPNPFPDDTKKADEYADLIGDDLTEHHVAALDTVASTLGAKRLDEDQMVAWMHAVNHLRLVMGTRLKVTEESEYEDFETDEEQLLFEMYSYLGAMLEKLVRALAGDDYL
jgi:Domain of unknown function (DUF2017)